MDQFGHDLKNESFLRVYYAKNCAQWAEWVPYAWPVACFGFLSDKLSWYAWNLADILLLTVSRAVYMKFKSLYEHSEAVTSMVRQGDRNEGNGESLHQLYNSLLHCA